MGLLMGREFISGQMEINLKGCFKMIKKMVEEYFFLVMGTDLKELLKMMYQTKWVFILIKMEVKFRDLLLIINL